jgi:dihydroneopterin aldolase
MTDGAFEQYERIYTAVHDLVDQMTCDMSEADAEDIRDKLTNEFRFWKRTSTGTQP